LYEKEVQATMDYMEEHSKGAQYAAHRACVDEEVPEDNSAFDYDYQRVDLPLDEEGYCISFSPEDEQGYARFFEKYGMVVVHGILSDEECSLTEDEIWEFISRHTDGRVKRDDPSSWEYWPALKKLGILGNEFILSPQCCQNRQNPKLARVFEVILGSDQLMVNVGRASAMRPTKQVLIDGQLVDKPEWKTLYNWLHWDMNPWTGLTTQFSWKSKDPRKNRGYDQTKVQGILSCVDCGPDDGGFHCVPGFHKHIRGWANKNLDKFPKKDFDLAGSLQVPKGDPIWQDVQKVPFRKGSIMIWSSCLPHGTFPNDSNHGRMIQYIKMARKDDPSIGPVFRNEHLLPDEFQLTPLGRSLLGLDDPDSDDE